MKRNIAVVTILLSLFGWEISHAEAIHCEAFYQGKPFVQATILSAPTFGPAECDYKNPGDDELTVYKFPLDKSYYTVSGNWSSTMPGFQWCSVKDGNTFESCRFAERASR